MKRKIICIVGPTASGKTSLAVFLAKKLNGLPADASGQLMQAGEIISADSRQVYKKLDIGTGKDLDEYDNVKYHLIDICEPEEKFTMFDWLNLARTKIDEIIKRGNVPIIVGGTGLYVQALIEGFEIKQGESKKIKYSREVLDKKNLEELQKIYSECSLPDSGIDLKNPRRLIRAIERAQEGSEPTKSKPDFDVLQIGIQTDRDLLNKKIDKRVEQWIDEGLIQEVKTLLKNSVSKDWLLEMGLEYRIITKYITEQDKDTEAAIEEIKLRNHQYAKRQITWFKRFPDIRWVKTKEEALKLSQDFLKRSF